MKRFKFISLILSITIMFSILTACNSEKNKPSEQVNASTSQPVKEKEPVNLKIWTPIHVSTAKTTTSLADHEIVKELEKMYNVNLEFVHPTVGHETEQFNIMLASGSYPDIIKYYFDSYRGGPQAAIKEGIIININDLIEKNAPNFKKIISSDPLLNKDVRADNGAIVKFGAMIADKEVIGLPNYGLAIRKDWLDSLNLKIPETIDEWYTVLKAFKDKKGCESPYTFPGKDGLGFLNGAFSGAFGVPNVGFYQENGKVLYAPIQPGYKEFLTTFNKWYKEGLIDQDFATHTMMGNLVNMAATGKAGAFSIHSVRFGGIYTSHGGKSSDFVLAAAPFPSLKKGEKTKFRSSTAAVSFTPFFVTKACKQPDEAVKFVDNLYSNEAQEIMLWGAAGKAHKVVDGKHQYTDLINKNPDGLALEEAKRKYCLTDLLTITDDEQFKATFGLPEQQDAWKVWGNSATYDGFLSAGLTLSEDESKKYSSLITEIDTYSAEMAMKFIMGLEPIEKFDAFVQQVKKMNIDEAVKIQQAALDRYNKR